VRRARLALLLLLALALGIGATLFVTSRLGGNGEILLEAKVDPGVDPFVPPGPVVSTQPSQGPAEASAPPSSPPTSVEPSGSPMRVGPSPSPSPSENPLAIYGSSGSNGDCDTARLVASLTADSTKAAAWASVLGITPDQIPDLVATFLSATLRHDTRVTNYGFANGTGTERQAVLEAGTAVLVDPTGVPVTRCLSGNPLRPAKAVSGTPTYTGTKWPGFDPSTVVASTTEPISVKRSQGAVVTPVATPIPTAAPTPSQSISSTAPPASAPPATATPSFEPAAGDLVVDGGFEDGVVAPWGTGIYEPRADIFWGAADASAVAAGSDAHSGAVALFITNGSSLAPNVYRTMSQAVAVTAGAQYCLSFWAKSLGSQPGILSFPLNVAWSSRITVLGGSYDWTEYAGTLTAESDSFDVRLISENQGSILVDDIEMTPGACAVPVGPVLPGQPAR